MIGHYHGIMTAVIIYVAALLLGLTPALLVIRRLRCWRVFLEPRCAKCHYIIVGLPSNICPECGSTLHKGTIITANMKRPVRRRMQTVIWTVLLASIGFTLLKPASGIIERYLAPHIPIRSGASVGFSLYPHIIIIDGKPSPQRQLHFDVLWTGKDTDVKVEEIVIFPSIPSHHNTLVLAGTLPPSDLPGLHIRISDLSYHVESRSLLQWAAPRKAHITREILRSWLLSHGLADWDYVIEAIWSVIRAGQSSPPDIEHIWPSRIERYLDIIPCGRILLDWERPMFAAQSLTAITLASIWLVGALVLLCSRSRIKSVLPPASSHASVPANESGE
jgi:hypothetical protein